MNKFIGVILILLAYSCIPLQIAPNIKGEKIVKAKKFKKTFQISTDSFLKTLKMPTSFTISSMQNII